MRIETVTYYVACDGTRFTSEAECLAHESLVAEVNLAMKPMWKAAELDSEHYVQHTREAVFAARRNLLKLIRSRNRWPCLAKEDERIDPRTDIIGRFLDGYDPLSKAWGRLSNTSLTSFREYNQPFFALNEDQFEGCELGKNPVTAI